jgi:hypothetical protein
MAMIYASVGGLMTPHRSLPWCTGYASWLPITQSVH